MDAQCWTVCLHRSLTDENFCCRKTGDLFIQQRIVPQNAGPFRVVEVLPSTLTFHRDGIANTVSIYRLTLAPTLIPVQHIMNGANNGNIDQLPTGPMRHNAHQKQVTDDIDRTMNTDKDERNVDNDNN